MPSSLSLSQPVPSRTEQELVAAVRAGSDTAFEELYSRYRERISAYITGMVSDHALAEDVAQEVFISALRRMRATERPIAFKPWLYQIAKNACVDEYRRGRRTREVPLELESQADTGTPAAALGSDAAVEGKQQLEDLRGAFRGLSDTHHKILVLRELEGRSYREIGDQMGMSKPVVESTLFRARRRLGEEYEELVSGRRCEQTQQLIAAGEERTWRSLRTRQRRQLARHLAHCQPCRRTARVANIDERFFDGRGAIGKVAALLPFPWLRLRRSRHAHGSPRSTPAEQLSALGPLQSLALYAEQATPAFAAGRVAAAAAALVIGGGSVVGLTSSSGTGGHGAPAPPVSIGAGPSPLTPVRPMVPFVRPFALSSAAPVPSHQRTSHSPASAKPPAAAPAGRRSSSIGSGLVNSIARRVSVGSAVPQVTSRTLHHVKVPVASPGGAAVPGGGSPNGAPQAKLPRLPSVPTVIVQQGTEPPSPAGTGSSSPGKPNPKSASGSSQSQPEAQPL